MEPHYKKLIRAAMMQSYEPSPQNAQQPAGTINHEKLEQKIGDIMEMQLANQPKHDWAGYYDTPLKQLLPPKGGVLIPRSPFSHIRHRP